MNSIYYLKYILSDCISWKIIIFYFFSFFEIENEKVVELFLGSLRNCIRVNSILFPSLNLTHPYCEWSAVWKKKIKSTWKENDDWSEGDKLILASYVGFPHCDRQINSKQSSKSNRENVYEKSFKGKVNNRKFQYVKSQSVIVLERPNK